MTYSERAQARIAQAVTLPGQAIDPASIMLVFTIIKEIVALCRNRGESIESVATSLARPSWFQRFTFRRQLKKHVGGTKAYRQLGGKQYADKVLAAGRSAPMSERRGFVSEVAPN